MYCTMYMYTVHILSNVKSYVDKFNVVGCQTLVILGTPTHFYATIIHISYSLLFIVNS